MKPLTSLLLLSETVSVSERAPPDPEFPLSLVVMVNVRVLLLVPPVNDIPFRALLMDVMVPESVMALSRAPSPTVKVSPVVLARVRVPVALAADVPSESDIVIMLVPASGSLMLMAFPLVVEKVKVPLLPKL